MKKVRMISIFLLVMVIVASVLPMCIAATITPSIAPRAELSLFVTLEAVDVHRTADSHSFTYVETLPKGTSFIHSGLYPNGYAQIYYYSHGMGEKLTGFIGGPICPRGECFYTTARSGLNLRKSPNATSDVVCTIPYNTFVQIHSASFPNGWGRCHVLEGDFHGKDGYVSQEYVAKYDGVNDWWYNHNP